MIFERCAPVLLSVGQNTRQFSEVFAEGRDLFSWQP